MNRHSMLSASRCSIGARSLRLRSSRRVAFPSGALLLELLISGLLLGIVMSAAIPTLGWIARQRKLSQQRQAAMLEVANLMERLTALDWDKLTSERAGEFELSESLRSQLDEPRLAIQVNAGSAAAE